MAGTININQLLTEDILLSDFLVKADSNGLATKATVQELANKITTTGDVAFKGKVASTDATVGSDGWYFAEDSGTYTNNGGLVIDLSNNLAIIIVSNTQTTFSKIDIPLNIAFDATPTEGSTKAVTSGGMFNVLDGINNNILPFLDFGTADVVLKNRLVGLLQNAEIKIPNTYNKDNVTVKIIYILKNQTISNILYNAINVEIYNSGALVTTLSCLSDATNGIVNLTARSGLGFVVNFKANWDSLPDGSYPISNSLNVQFTNSSKITDFGVIYDQAFIKSGKLVCYNDDLGSSGTLAKYMQVKLDSPGKKIMTKFTTKGGIVALIFTPLQTRNYIQNIVNSSIHVVFDTSNVNSYRFVNQSQVGVVTTPYGFSLDTTGNTEYEVGFEVLDQNTLRLYLPSGSTQDITITDVKDNTGDYAIFEFYNSGLAVTPVPTTDFQRPTFNGIFALGDSVDAVALQDNFKREDGVIQVAPSGHPYTLFRNSYTGITKYVTSNGNYTL